ncbi:MAG: FUN14 domain-containing protein [Aquificaceae bacterium]
MSDIFFDLGFFSLLGLTVGYAVRKLVGFFALLMGIYVLSLMWLASKGVLSVNWGALEGVLLSAAGGFYESITMIFKKLTLGAGFVAGFALGYRGKII